MSDLGKPLTEFEEFPKLSRLSKDMIVTEKIDGRNACLIVTEDFNLLTASRTGFVIPGDDNQGFAAWAQAHRDELIKLLGPGRHYGEWWGQGIPESKRYKLKHKRFSLFNTHRWGELFPSDGNVDSLLHVTPVLYKGPFDTSKVDLAMFDLKETGSRVAPGCMDPEGVVVFHVASNTLFKKTFGGDGHKGAAGV